MENRWQVQHGVLIILLADAGDYLRSGLDRLNVWSIERGNRLVVFVHVADDGDILDNVLEGDFV